MCLQQRQLAKTTIHFINLNKFSQETAFGGEFENRTLNTNTGCFFLYEKLNFDIYLEKYFLTENSPEQWSKRNHGWFR